MPARPGRRHRRNAAPWRWKPWSKSIACSTDCPARCAAFLLAQLEGLRHAEIADRMQVSVSSVRQYLARAMQHCLAAW